MNTLRATGITDYLKSQGTLENAQQIANHSSPRTTKLYDRRTDSSPTLLPKHWPTAHETAGNTRYGVKYSLSASFFGSSPSPGSSAIVT